MSHLNEPIICFDVDQTLIMINVPGGAAYHRDALEFTKSIFGTVYAVPHKKHIEYLKQHFNDGWKIVVWSKEGCAWVEEVCKVLGISAYVHHMMAKPSEVVDDLTAPEILDNVTYLPYEE